MFRIHSKARHLVLVAVFGALTTTGLRAGAKFSGATGYQIVKDGAAVSLEADFIENSSGNNATGTLMVKLWALEAPYKGGTLNGFLLGSCKLDGLAPGKRYAGFKKIVGLAAPRVRKNYVICLALSEFKGGAYGIVDYRNMPKPRLLGPLKMFELDGPWKWQTSYEGGTIDISVAKISHHRAGRTGSLRLSAWATKEPYNGGMLRGYELGAVEKKALDPGYAYTNVQNVAKFNAPPDGDYYVCLVLSEFGSDKKYSVVDHLPASKRSTFRAPSR